MNHRVLSPRFPFQPLEKYITEASDYAKYSFVLQPNLYYIDLNLCEYSKNDKPINDLTSFKRENDIRRILDRLHLDIPSTVESKDIIVIDEFTVAETINLKWPLLHPGRIRIPQPLHFNRLDGLIVEFIKNSTDKLGTIKRFLEPIQKMKLYERSTGALSLYEHFLPLLHQECKDSSTLVVDLMKVFGCRFLKWVLHTKKVDLELFLYHAQKMQYDIWDLESHEPVTYQLAIPIYPVNCPFYPVNECCIMGNLRNVPSLVKYGLKFECYQDCLRELQKYVFRCLTPRGSDNFFAEILRNVEISSMNIRVARLSLERSCHLFLAIQLFLFKIYVFMSTNSPAVNESLGCIWNSIAEPYFCRSELVAVFRFTNQCELPNALVEFCNFYNSSICDGSFGEFYNPRSLKHLCRCQIRNVLADCWHLPHGIEELNVPRDIELYLSLGL